MPRQNTSVPCWVRCTACLLSLFGFLGVVAGACFGQEIGAAVVVVSGIVAINGLSCAFGRPVFWPLKTEP